MTTAPKTPRTTPAKTTAAKTAAAKAAPAPVADLADLATKVTEIKALPKVANGGGNTRTNPFLPLVESAAAEGKVFTTPPVADDKQALRVVDALWRAADKLGVKVSTRRVRKDDGTVEVAFTAVKK